MRYHWRERRTDLASLPMAEIKRIRTDLEIRALSCPEALPFRDESLRDPKFPGLQIRGYRGGRKVFFLVCRFPRDPQGGKLGFSSPPRFGMPAARIEARHRLCSCTKRRDAA